MIPTDKLNDPALQLLKLIEDFCVQIARLPASEGFLAYRATQAILRRFLDLPEAYLAVCGEAFKQHHLFGLSENQIENDVLADLMCQLDEIRFYLFCYAGLKYLPSPLKNMDFQLIRSPQRNPENQRVVGVFNFFIAQAEHSYTVLHQSSMSIK